MNTLLRLFLAAACPLAQLAQGAKPYSDNINPELLHDAWSAQWIVAPETEPEAYGVYFFRKRIELPEKPDSFIVHVSADNRYKLYINETFVSMGPARGDPYYWKYDTINLAPYLQEGSNQIAAVVWNGGEHTPKAQMSIRTGFIMQGNDETERIIDTDESWRALKSDAYAPLPGIGYRVYYVSGPGEIVDMKRLPQNWQSIDFDDSSWGSGSSSSWRRGYGQPKGMRNMRSWMLVPRDIPPLTVKPTRYTSVRKSEGVATTEGFVAGHAPIVIPSNSKATLLLDHSVLVNAHSLIAFSGGLDATIELSYAETLFDRMPERGERPPKSNRNEIEGKVFSGRTDRIHSSGADDQLFSSLAWRTFRYTRVQVETKDDPLTIKDVWGESVGYPFETKATLSSEDETLHKILEVGDRTIRLCAIETYMDCPYYEQLQYIGDARIQLLAAYYRFGDKFLARSALDQMDHSRLAEGVTLSRHPSRSPQIISTYSLWYISLLHDYWKYCDDAEFIAEKLEGAQQVLNFFSKFQTEDGTLRNAPYWLYTDWVRSRDDWVTGQPPFGSDGESSVLDLQLLIAYQAAAEMERDVGRKYHADEYIAKAEQLAQSIRKRYWDADLGLMRDNAERSSTLSQHANILGILTGVISEEEAPSVAALLLSRADLAPASIYFKFYLHQALTQAGLGDDYLNWLDVWRGNLELGLTTWAENLEINESRSDCHGWGASPSIEIYRTVLGIDSAGRGFSQVNIEPHLGAINKIGGSIPHPKGEISVSYEKMDTHWEISISLPEDVDGKLVWQGTPHPLKGGLNRFSL